jgi:hypothetical protein
LVVTIPKGEATRQDVARKRKMKKLIFVALVLSLSIPAFAHGGHGGGRGGGHGASHGGSHSGGSHSISRGSRPSKAATGTGSKSQREHVSSYTRKNGTHVASHDRSTGDSTKRNNWSTKGNVNPETGKAGTK